MAKLKISEIVDEMTIPAQQVQPGTLVTSNNEENRIEEVEEENEEQEELDALEKLKKKKANEEKQKLENEESEEEEEEQEEESEEEEEQEEEEQEEEDDDLSSMSRLQLLGEIAKADGLIPDDVKIKKNIQPDEFLKTVTTEIQKKEEAKFEEAYGKGNYDLFIKWVNGEYTNDEASDVVKTSMYYQQLATAKIDGNSDDAKKDRMALMKYYFKNVKGLTDKVANAAIEEKVIEGKEVEFVQTVQNYFGNQAEQILNKYNQKVESDKNEKSTEILTTLKGSKLEELNLKKEEDRNVLIKAFTERTESIKVKDEETGKVQLVKMTEAEVLLDSIYKNPKIMVTIVAHLKKLNDLGDSEKQLKKKRKKNIFREFKKDTDSKVEESGQRKGKYPLWEQMKQG